MIMVGLLFAITAFVDFLAKVWTVNIYPFGFISMTMLTCLLAYSIIRYKAFDIETVIHKTILWILSFSLIAAPIFFLYQWFFPVMKNSVFLQLAFGIMSFIVFTLYLRLIQPKIDHVFQRRKADMEETSNRFVADLVHLQGLDNLIEYIEETITSTLYARWVDVFLYDKKIKDYHVINKGQGQNWTSQISEENVFVQWLKENNRIVHRDFIEIDPQYASIREAARDFFESTEATVAIPLILNEQLLGIINLSKKSNLKRYSANKRPTMIIKIWVFLMGTCSRLYASLKLAILATNTTIKEKRNI